MAASTSSGQSASAAICQAAEAAPTAVFIRVPHKRPIRDLPSPRCAQCKVPVHPVACSLCITKGGWVPPPPVCRCCFEALPPDCNLCTLAQRQFLYERTNRLVIPTGAAHLQKVLKFCHDREDKCLAAVIEAKGVIAALKTKNTHLENEVSMHAWQKEFSKSTLMGEMAKDRAELAERWAALAKEELQLSKDKLQLVKDNVQVYKQFGNSVSVPVVHAIAQKIVEVKKFGKHEKDLFIIQYITLDY